MRKETHIQKIVRLAAKQFASFGGGKLTPGNPISAALADQRPVFAGGVDIEQVVRFVLAKRNALEYAKRQKTGDDARDYVNPAFLLSGLSNKALNSILRLKRREIKTALKEPVYPFSLLSKETRETLSRLPASWILGGTKRTLDFRKKHEQ
jgi:hypothetical protein